MDRYQPPQSSWRTAHPAYQRARRRRFIRIGSYVLGLLLAGAAGAGLLRALDPPLEIPAQAPQALIEQPEMPSAEAEISPPSTVDEQPEPLIEVVRPAPMRRSTPDESVYYRNCAAARAAGVAPIARGMPGYREGLDRDNDGWACEPYAG